MLKVNTLKMIAKNAVDKCPAIAEQHLTKDFTILVVRDVPSKYVEGLYCKRTSAFFVCPSCRGLSKHPDHGSIYACKCGLQLLASGTALFIWKSE